MTSRREPRIDNLERRIAAIISRVVGSAIDAAEDDLENLDIDSLRRLEILALLEKEFVVTLTEDVVADFQSISRLSRIIRQARASERGAQEQKKHIPSTTH
ncbi:MAG: acyl carrier protein [Myxococcales bacterium]|jgi:acyl carrier protein|nr:acyl carrier protein [Myxococcales bacterium]